MSSNLHTLKRVSNRLPILVCLAFSLLFGQLATVWHGVTHFQLQPQSISQTAHGVSTLTHVSDHKLFSETHSVSSHLPIVTAGNLLADFESDHCLIYHVYACLYAQLPTIAELPDIRYRVHPSQDWQVAAILEASSKSYMIRGPPARS